MAWTQILANSKSLCLKLESNYLLISTTYICMLFSLINSLAKSFITPVLYEIKLLFFDKTNHFFAIWFFRHRYRFIQKIWFKLQITSKSFQGHRNAWGREDWSSPYFGRLVNQGNRLYPPLKLVPSTIFNIPAALFIA